MANLEYESMLVAKGYKIIAGVDEAGRGPLAGPLVVACVILPPNYQNEAINDSKQISAKKRKELSIVIKNIAISYNIVTIDEKTIDEINIYQATKKGMVEAVMGLKVVPDAVLVDAMKLDINIYSLSIIKGDEKSLNIAAASILAKVHRDELMEEYHKIYPCYGFKRNKGYGTKEHLVALEKFGPCAIHRFSYEPVRCQKIKIEI